MSFTSNLTISKKDHPYGKEKKFNKNGLFLV